MTEQDFGEAVELAVELAEERMLHQQTMAERDWLRAEVERLQRYEAMWQDCRRHRDQAEKRARRYMDIVRQVAKLVVPDEERI